MRTKQFKAESKRLLDLMIHSIYTHREIFLRELISNASDAMDKLYFRSLTDTDVGLSREDFQIKIDLDKENRTFTIRDNGIGMTQEELETNLGTIAKSGSLAFKQENESKDEVDIIGQFGVGFYSAFMVSDMVTVKSRAFGSEEAYKWQSKGVEGYTIQPCEMAAAGTEITLNIKENTEEENYDEFLEPYRIQELIKKYSDYIRYPIKMDLQESRLKEGSEDEYETVTETKTVNSMVPIWRKNKNELTQEDYENFYHEKFYDYEKPLKVIHSKTEGSATYDALLYIPAKAPYDYYSKEFQKGLQLYSNGVLIMDKCPDLLPDCFSFVRGLVDSADLSLNISREMLQHDRQLKLIEKSLEKKIKNELLKLQKSEPEAYETFFKAFGLQLKFGIYNNYGMQKDLLQDLLMFYSSTEKKLVSLADYVSRMKEGQKEIYYASGEDAEKIDHLPQTELVKDKGYEILYFTDNVDEFAIQMLHEFDGKGFKSVSAGDLDLEDEQEKEELKKQSDENKELFDFMKEALEGKVKEVRLSSRLKNHAVCLTNDGSLSLEMEKVLNAMPGDQKVKAERILELNASHPVFLTLAGLLQTNPEKLKEYANLLYTQALLVEGFPIEDPVAYSNAICSLMAEKK